MCAEPTRFLPRACARPGGARGAQRGQALLEALVAAIALVPLVLLVVWLGKVGSIRQATIAASRTLAFECTVRLDTCADPARLGQLTDEVRRRSFSRGDAPIFSLERLPDLAPASERNPLWVDRGNQPLIERFGDIGARIETAPFDAGLSLATSRAGGIVGNAAQVLSDLAGPGRFGLEIERGLVDARVQANVSASRTPDRFQRQLDSIPLQVKARTAVLTDGWTAVGPYGGDPRTVESRVDQGKRLLAAYEASIDARYALTRGFIGLMDAIGLEPTGSAFRYHEADVDLVPADRVGP